LTRRRLLAHLKRFRPAWAGDLLRAAAEEIISALVRALAEGRPVALNGFGRLSVRRYPGPRKRIGLIFRPGARLSARLNTPPLDE
jgi:nucleoid DNA-binding protein